MLNRILINMGAVAVMASGTIGMDKSSHDQIANILQTIKNWTAKVEANVGNDLPPISEEEHVGEHCRKLQGNMERNVKDLQTMYDNVMSDELVKLPIGQAKNLLDDTSFGHGINKYIVKVLTGNPYVTNRPPQNRSSAYENACRQINDHISQQINEHLGTTRMGKPDLEWLYPNFKWEG